jgi:hypothetical protein
MFLDNKSMFKLRKECNAEGKISACQRPSFISAVLLNVHQTIIDIKCDFFKNNIKCTSATQFDICQMTNRTDLYNNWTSL